MERLMRSGKRELRGAKALSRNNHAKSWRPMWRTHSCVPCRDSSRHLLARGKPGVGTSADAARTSACATSEWQGYFPTGTGPAPEAQRGLTPPRRASRGFTFVELMVVIAIMVILISMAIPIYQKSITRAKESVLANNLFTLRTVIDNYTYDKEKAPQALQDLVSEGYLKDVPVDPMTGDNSSWKIVMEDASQALNQAEPGIFDVHSGSDKKGLDGVPYAEW